MILRLTAIFIGMRAVRFYHDNITKTPQFLPSESCVPTVNLQRPLYGCKVITAPETDDIRWLNDIDTVPDIEMSCLPECVTSDVVIRVSVETVK